MADRMDEREDWSPAERAAFAEHAARTRLTPAEEARVRAAVAAGREGRASSWLPVWAVVGATALVALGIWRFGGGGEVPATGSEPAVASGAPAPATSSIGTTPGGQPASTPPATGRPDALAFVEPPSPEPSAPAPVTEGEAPRLLATPRNDESSGRVTQSLATVTQSLGGERAVAVAPGVRLDVTGSGAVSGTERDLAVRWDQGTLGVEVEPGKGIALAVTTSEARVEVVGTGFTVTRDALGTSVAVAHGIVTVTCSDAPPGLLRLEAGADATCAPTSAAALLGRANALRRRGDGTDTVLAAVRAGLSKAEPSTAVYGELALVEVQVLAESGAAGEAVSRAEVHLSRGLTNRRREVGILAVGAARQAGDCAAAVRIAGVAGVSAPACE